LTSYGITARPDGSLDAGFGSGGVLITTFNGNVAVQAVLIQPDGKIIAVGNSRTTPAASPSLPWPAASPGSRLTDVVSGELFERYAPTGQASCYGSLWLR
jgi:hypothetical protein